VVSSLGSPQHPIAIERSRTERRLRELGLEHAAETIDDATYLSRAAELRAQRDRLAAEEAPRVPAERAVAWLRSIGDAIQHADVPAERAEVVHAVYDRIVVAGRTFVSARLSEAAYRHGLTLALPEVVMARPTGFERGDAINIRIPIEGADNGRMAAGA